VGKQVTQRDAAVCLGLSDRQMRRLSKRMKQEGDQGLVHRGCGKPSNRRISEKRTAKALQLYEQQYGDCGPTLAAEKLAERDGILLSEEPLRRWLRARGIDHFRRRSRHGRARPARSRRSRTIRGAHGCCQNTNPGRQQPLHKKPDICMLVRSGHLYSGLTLVRA
jgi:transposase